MFNLGDKIIDKSFSNEVFTFKKYSANNILSNYFFIYEDEYFNYVDNCITLSEFRKQKLKKLSKC